MNRDTGVNRDIIAIGGSAGAVDVLLDMAAKLPAGLPASIFIVLHTLPNHSSVLPELLTGRGRLPASYPLDGEKIAPGHIYVAPSDNHLLVREGSMEVSRGPRENGHRPAVDALFRTASAAYGLRVVGVVLSGHQDCGTAGMMSIKARGGVTVAQAPDTAQVSEMPECVIERVAVDHVVQPSQLARLLELLVYATPDRESRPDAFVTQLEGGAPGTRAELVCPTCQGVLTEAKPGEFHHFRCHVGHAFSLDSLVQEQSEEMERALWAALRSLEESASLSRRLAAGGTTELRQRFVKKAKTQTDQADLIRQILLHGSKLDRSDAADLGVSTH